MTRRGWRPAGGWEAIVGGIGRDREVVYWRRRLADGTYLTVQGRTWHHRGTDKGPGGVNNVLASGIAETLAKAKKAAETAARGPA